MSGGLNIAFFGSSLVSAYWNGAATYYRGIVKALHARGHRITFYEPDAYERQQHRDIPDPDWARVVVYPGHGNEGVQRALDSARGADIIIKASGVGVFDGLLEQAVLQIKRPSARVIFWDVDAPATLDRLNSNASDPFRVLIPRYDFILTSGGGEPVVNAYNELGAKLCVPIYGALDPETHYPVQPLPQYQADLSYLGNRPAGTPALPREAQVGELFLRVAEQCPKQRFLLGGSGWDNKHLPPNVTYVGHVYTPDHNAFNCSPRAVLAGTEAGPTGFSPTTRIFEAAGAAACTITDHWAGIEEFLEPGQEILVGKDSNQIAEIMQTLTPEKAHHIGQAAYRRVRSQHTYAHRVQQLESILAGKPSAARIAATGAAKSIAAPVDGLARTSVVGPASVPAGAVDTRSRTAKPQPLSIVILGLSITSSWENGHASTYRGLMRELCARGHHVLFLERDLPSYANHRDLPGPPYGRTELYSSFEDLTSRFGNMVRDADLVIVGSYVPDGIELGQWVTRTARGRTAFYDIDTPITLRTLAGGTCEYLCPELIPRYSLYLSFSGGPALRTLQHSYGAVAVRPLYAFADPELYRPSGIEPQWDLGYLGTYSSDRQPALERLLIDPARREPDLSFAVAGPQYPVELQWPRNVRLIEHLPLSEHCRFYNAQRFTLNVTRTDMAKMGFSPSIRLFEAAACGTPIISDYWKGLSTFFEPGIEILTARSKYDVLEILLHLPEKTRIELAAKARARVLLSHTAAHRAEQLEQYAHQLLVKSAKHRAGRASVPGAVISAAAKGVPPATTAQGTDSRSATISPQ